MKEKIDIQIDPKLEEEGLMFYFASKAVELIKIDRSSDAYRFSTHIMDSLLKKYKDHTGKIGLIGNDLETIKVSLTLILEGYHEFIETAFLRDLVSFQCQTDFASRYWNGSQGDSVGCES